MNLKSTGMDLLKDKIKCGTDFVKNCQGITDAVVNACLAKVISLFSLVSGKLRSDTKFDCSI